MKVIFLGFDGTVNNANTFKEFEGRGTSEYPIDKAMLLRLKKIVDETGAKIVLCAPGRRAWNKKLSHCHGKMKELTEQLMALGLEIYDRTPYIDGKREEEISEYFLTHDVSSFVILDSESADLRRFWNRGLIKLNKIPYGQPLKNMTEATGIQNEDAVEAIRILNKLRRSANREQTSDVPQRMEVKKEVVEEKHVPERTTPKEPIPEKPVQKENTEKYLWVRSYWVIRDLYNMKFEKLYTKTEIECKNSRYDSDMEEMLRTKVVESMMRENGSTDVNRFKVEPCSKAETETGARDKRGKIGEMEIHFKIHYIADSNPNVCYAKCSSEFAGWLSESIWDAYAAGVKAAYENMGYTEVTVEGCTKSEYDQATGQSDLLSALRRLKGQRR